MAKYKGKTVRVEAPAADIAAKFSDLTVLGAHIDRVPEDQRNKLGNLRFEPDAIAIKNPSVGEMVFKVTERTDKRIVFNADGMLPLQIDVTLDPAPDNTGCTDVTTTLDIDIPVMLRPFIGSKLQQVADSFGDLIGHISKTQTSAL